MEISLFCIFEQLMCAYGFGKVEFLQVKEQAQNIKQTALFIQILIKFCLLAVQKNIPKLDFSTSLVLVFFVFVFGHPFLVMKILSWFSRSKLQEIFKNWQNLWHQYPSVPRQRSFEPLHYV